MSKTTNTMTIKQITAPLYRSWDIADLCQLGYSRNELENMSNTRIRQFASDEIDKGHMVARGSVEEKRQRYRTLSSKEHLRDYEKDQLKRLAKELEM